MDTGAAIEMIGVNKWFGDFHVLKDVSMSVNPGERVVLCASKSRVFRLEFRS